MTGKARGKEEEEEEEHVFAKKNSIARKVSLKVCTM